MTEFLKDMKARVLARVKTIRIETDGTTNPSDFCALFNDRPAIISEIKFASPSRGLIYKGHMSPVQIAKEYIANGASALSILTEPHFFKGDIHFIHQIRAQHPTIPILLKDFVLDPIQIKQAQVFGANAVLLIVGFLEPSQLHELYAYVISLGLTPFIEVHNADELEEALKLNPKIIGVNNRNLQTLRIDLDTSRALIPLIPDDVFAVCESGITTLAEINAMTSLGFDGFLMGTHLMQTNHPGQALGELLSGEDYAS